VNLDCCYLADFVSRGKSFQLERAHAVERYACKDLDVKLGFDC
jgi:hypothetical protein